MPDVQPILNWCATLVLVAGVAAGAWFIHDQRERTIEIGNLLADVRHEQEGIRKELAEHSLLLNRIEDDQADQTAASDRRFAMRAAEHRSLSLEIHQGLLAMAREAGWLGRLHRGDTSPEHTHERNGHTP